jgi:drug/metabolite transporter (DMT)-like permease
VTYVIPIFSTLLGVTILSESVTWNQPVGAAIVLGSMWAASRPGRQPREDRESSFHRMRRVTQAA